MSIGMVTYSKKGTRNENEYEYERYSIERLLRHAQLNNCNRRPVVLCCNQPKQT